jgi:hypothetical protein
VNEWLYDFYKSNKDFKDWVDTYCKGYNLGIFEVLNDPMTEVVAEYYRDKENDESSKKS